MILKTLAGLASACLLATTSACSTLGGLGPTGITSGNTQQIVDNIKAFNEVAATGPCGGWGNLDWSPPLPPTGGLHVMCQVGNPQVTPLRQLSPSSAAVPAPVAPAPVAASPPSFD
jgi:hypothetical protein